ncbi:MAG: BspA family leucine-rich repeat surface protein [Bacteroidales bacterium]|nr:BspA family leucine-rich repeat surface protein [Bacteroidales bacterium]
MKKFTFVLAALALIGFAASCQKENTSVEPVAEENTSVISFTATFDDTKAHIDGVTPIWDKDDQIRINVFGDTGNATRVATHTYNSVSLKLASGGSSTAVFEFNVADENKHYFDEATIFWALYKGSVNSSNFVADKRTVNGDADRAFLRYEYPGANGTDYQTNESVQARVAYSTDRNLHFQNVFHLLRFTPNLSSGATKAVLTRIDGGEVARNQAKVIFDSSTGNILSIAPDGTEGNHSVYSVTRALVTGENYFALIPGMTLTGGFKIELKDDGDNVLQTFTYAHDFTTARNKITTIRDFDTRVEDAAGKAVLKDGYSVNAALKKLADGGTPSYYTNNTSITSIVVDTRSSVNTGTLVSATSSAFPIYANFDGGVITLSTPAGKVYFPSDASAFFYYMRGLTSVDMQRMNTEDVVSANQMFAFCSALPTFGNIDFPKATNASYMFTNCTSLQTVGEINLPLAQNVGNLLSGCPIQTLGDLNLPAATNTSFAFQNCGSLTQVGAVNMPLVQDASYMFSYCGSLATIGPIQMDAITTATSMFDSCGSLTSLTLNGVGNNTLVNMGRMFYGCAELSTLNFAPVTNVATSTDQMFYNCKKLTSVDISGISGNLASVSGMFYNCELLTGISFNSAFNTSAVTSFSAMFSGCLALASLDLSTFDTSAATNMYEMFRACRNLTTIGATTVFTTTALTSTDRMFSGCRNLESVDLSSLAGHLESITEMFSSCEKLTTIHLSNNFNTEAVANYSYVFYYCRSLSQLYIKGFHLTKGVIGTTTVSSRMMNALGSVPTSCTIHYTTHNSSTEYDVRYFLPYTTTSGSGTGGYNWTTAN